MNIWPRISASAISRTARGHGAERSYACSAGVYQGCSQLACCEISLTLILNCVYITFANAEEKTSEKNAPVPLSCSQLKFSASVRTSNYSSMSVASVFLLSLLLPLVEIHCQPSSYVSFRDQTLVNHSYVDLSQVYFSSDGSDSVQCHTDLSTCCTHAEGIHRGDWYFPDSTQLPFGGPLFESRGPQRVDIRHKQSGPVPHGIYRCDIQTTAVHDDTDTSVRETLFVGLYTDSGKLFVDLECSYYRTLFYHT